MNQIVISQAEQDTCPLCAGEHHVRADMQDYNITGIIPCPVCVDPGRLKAFLFPFMDYLQRPKAVAPDVIA